MGRYRSRSYSPRRSRSPPRRKRYDDPRDRYRSSKPSYRDRRPPGPSGLLVRNIALNARPEDLRIPFEHFGPVKDVYLPKNYYTGEPRGFGFVKFHNPIDAAEAKDQMDRQLIGGREIRIVFAEENRKTPQEMRVTSHVSPRNRRRSPPRSPRRRYHSYSRSPSPVWRESRDRGGSSRKDYYSPQRSISKSPPRRGKSISRSPSRQRGRSYSGSPSPRNSPIARGKMSISRSPPRKRSLSRSPSMPRRSISRSPRGRHGSRTPSPRERSVSRSPPHRRSLSRSLSPRGKKITSKSSHAGYYRKEQRSPSPGENGRSSLRSPSNSPSR